MHNVLSQKCTYQGLKILTVSRVTVMLSSLQLLIRMTSGESVWFQTTSLSLFTCSYFDPSGWDQWHHLIWSRLPTLECNALPNQYKYKPLCLCGGSLLGWCWRPVGWEDTLWGLRERMRWYQCLQSSSRQSGQLHYKWNWGTVYRLGAVCNHVIISTVVYKGVTTFLDPVLEDLHLW